MPPRLTQLILAVALGTCLTGTPAAAQVVSLKEIRETGVVLQKWDKSCGAAALATVLTYHFGDRVSEKEVAAGMLRRSEPLQVRYQGGFSLLDMKRFVEGRNYRGYGFRELEFDDVRYFDAPIVPINFHGYDHYVVFKGVKPNGDVWVADPSFGNFTMSRDRFERIWKNGMAFVVLRGTQ